MKISLIIPAYNEEQWIGGCLSHIQKNAPEKFHEIIVIDNASTDKTGEVAAGFPGVRVVREDKKGLVQARQRGYIEAKGDILAYMDADSHVNPGWYERIERAFTKRPGLAAISGPYLYYDANWLQNLLTYIWYVLAYPLYLALGYMMTGGNFAIKRSVLDQMKGFDTSIEFYGEDTNIARRAHKFGKVLFSISFIMPTSGRRLKNQGAIKTGYLYAINFFSEVVRSKPASKVYEDYR